MRRPAAHRTLRLALVLAALGAVVPAVASARAEPFGDDLAAIASAFAAERMAARLESLASSSGPEGADARSTPAAAPSGEDGDAVAATLADDWPMLGADLARLDAALASTLRGSLAAVAGAADAGERGLAAARAAAYAHDAAATLEGEHAGGAAFMGAVASLLLVGDGGVAETYGNGVEAGDVAAFATGRAELERVRALWGELSAGADPRQRFEAEDALSTLDALFRARPRGAAAGGAGDDAETPALRLVGFLEEILDADLVPDRDLARLVRALGAEAARACGAGAAALDRGRAIVAFYYGGFVAPTAAMLAPDADAMTRAALDELASGAGEAACRSVQGGLDAVAAAFGG